MLRRYHFGIIVVLCSLLMHAPYSHGATSVNGTISSDTTWNVAASPYYVTGTITVASGVTLTVEPGVAVKFAQGQAMFINGTLNAVGTSGQPIVFTDYRDDTAGGDTNADGSATGPYPGWWRGIEISNGGYATFDHCTVSYAGSSYANIYKNGSGALTVTNSLVSDSSSHGIYLNGATSVTTISGSTISGNVQHGVYASGDSPATVSTNTISNNGKYGVYAPVAAPATFSVNSNTFSGNLSAPVGVTAASSGIAVGSANSGLIYILIEGGSSISSNQVWGTSGAALVYHISGSMTIDMGRTLTVQPNTVIKSAPGVYIHVNGTLDARSTSGNEIVFTELRDDTAGGDSNGDGPATTPTPGGWRGIEVYDNGSAMFDYCRIRYAGSNVANVYKTGANGTLSITNSQVVSSVNYGIYLNGAVTASTISNSVISGNLQYGIYAAGASPASVNGNTVSNNGRYGIYASVSAPATFTVNGNSFSGNLTAPIGVTAASSGIAIGSGNSYTGATYTLVESGSVSTSQSWGTAGTGLVYYLAGSVNVDAGKTLTVLPRTVVKSASGTGIFVYGTLNSVATSGNEISFTDFRDDSVGGDSNLDGTATSPAPGGWRGIEVYDGGSATFDFCLIRYAGSTYANVYKTGANGSLNISNSQISSSVNQGIYLNGAVTASTIATSTVSGNLQHGIYAAGDSPATISGSAISMNTLYGVYANVTNPAAFSLSGNTFTGDRNAPIAVAAASSGIAIAASNTFNGRKHVHVEGGTIAGSQTWGNGSTLVYYIADNVTINANQTLTVQPNTVVKFLTDRALFFNGNLNANGSAGNSIYFTDYRDDVGGDTNMDGSATAPVPGGWRGIELNNYAGATLNFCVLRYGGSASGQQAILYKTGEGNVSISNSTVSDAAYRGISLINTTNSVSIATSIIRDNAAYNFYLSGSGTTPAITKSQISGSNIGIYAASAANPLVGGSTENGNDIFDNITYSVQNASTSPTINATFNWWGASDGAKTTGINKVSSYVDTGSYLTASVFSNSPFVPAPPKTTIGNTTYGSGTTNWTLANSPYYITGDVTVNPGATLAIEAGVVIKFAQYVGLHIYGTLTASGTSGSGRIYFTDYRDDTVGGDTNGDGSATDPAPGWWRGVMVFDGGSASIANCVVRYGGFSGPNSSNLYKAGANGTLIITDTVATNSSGYGLYLNNAATTTISGSTFSYNSLDGILAGSDSPASITNCSFTGNGRYGIYASVSNPATFLVNSGNSFTYNALAPIGVTAASAGIVVAAGNSFTGVNYILVEGGSISVSQTWGTGHPYYYLNGDVTVNAGPTLTIQPGTVVKFTQYVGLHINGTLKAEGTSGSRITFTDFRDDTVGGDSNGDGAATVPAPGWWRGILVNDGAYATITYSDVRYGGHAGPNSSNLYKTGANGTLTVADSTLSYSSSYGLYLNNASAAATAITNSSFSYNGADGILAGSNSPTAITGCSFTGNGRYGIYVSVSAPSTFLVNTGNSFTYNGSAPIGVTAASAGIVVAAGNAFSGANYIRIEDGSISGNQTWGNGHPYYLVGSVTVPAGLTLTVKPGSVLKFPQDIGLWVNGSLDAQGTGVKKIYFTDVRDDAAGGDNNGDGSSTAPATGWWRGVNIQNGGSATLDYCVIRYGGRNAPGYGNLYKNGSGSLTVNHSSFSYSGNHGIYLGDATGTVSITGSAISTNVSEGIYADRNSTATISGTAFTGNGRWGIYAAVTNPAGFVVSGNSFSYNSLAPIGVSAAGSGIAVAADNVFTGRSYIYVEDGSVAGNPTWGNGTGASYYLAGNVTVPPGLTLTITPGTVVKFTQNIGLHINGSLTATGTALNRIYFSDIRDDASGGDTNADGAATVPAPGWWRGILVNDGGSASIAYSVIRYGGSSGPNSSNVYKTGSGSFSLSNSIVADSSYYGLYLNGASAGSSLSVNTYRNNGYDGIYATSNSPFTETGSSFIGNSRYGIYSDAASTAAVSITGCTFTANASTPIRTTAVGSGAVVSDDCVFTGPLVVEGGTIGSSLAWANNRIYYIVGSITVPTGTTLGITAGRTVKFGENTGLFISGSLSAVGTSGSRIYFTDYRDDTVGGDTNGDGGASTPGAAWWYGIHFYDGGAGVIDYATVRYARSGDYGYPYYVNVAGVYKTGSGNLSVTNSTIENTNNFGIRLINSSGVQTISTNIVRNNDSHGILVQNAGTSVTVSGNTVTASGTGGTGYHGIYLENTPATISNNTVSGSGGYGLYITGVELPASVVLNTLNGNGLGGVGMAADSSGAAIDANNTFAGPIHVEGGNLTRDTSWVNDRVYYLRGDVTVNGGRTLTVPAGRIVKFAQNTGLWISGVLTAIGTSGSRVYFTDYRDDTAGGDTNGDGGGSTPAAAWWYGIHFNDGGSGVIDYATIRYARSGDYGYPYYNNFAGVYKTGSGNLSVTNSTVEYTNNFGIRLINSSGVQTVSNNILRNNDSHGILVQNAGTGVTVSGNTVTASGTGGTGYHGIYLENTPATVSGNTVSGSGGYGLYITGVELPASVTLNTLNGNGLGGVGMSADSSGAVINANNTFTGPIHVEGGTLSRDTSWVNDRVYYLRGTMTVNGTKTLTVPPGRIVKFGQNTGIWVYGTLNAVGTSGNRIYFTDYRDDTAGGDTNGDSGATTPGAAWWYGLIIKDGGSGVIDFATIRYTFGGSYGYPYYDSFAGVYKTGSGSLTLGNSAVEYSSGYGVWLVGTSGSISVNGSNFRNNGNYGVVIENASAMIGVTGNTFEYNAHSGLYVGNSSPLIQGNIMRYNTNYGIYAYGGSMFSSIFKNTIFGNSIGIYCTSSANPLIGGSADNGNSIFGNTGYGVQNTTAAIQVNATYNWWGTSTGPYHPSLNPLGAGNRVSDYVDFGQFLTNPAVPIAMAQVMPASKPFGHVTTGSVSASQAFTVTNNGTRNLDFTSISITGTNDSQFRITQNLCSGQSLATGGSCTISADYEPTVSGPARAQLTIVSNDIYAPTLSVPLTGAGSVVLPFRDDFSSGTRAAGWFIINEDPAVYTLTESIGYLRLYTTPTNFWGATNNAKNLFTIAMPDNVSQFAATAKLLFPVGSPTWTPNQNYQQGGVMLMAEKDGAPDLDNYMRAQYAYDGGRRFETSYDINSTPGGFTGGIQSAITSSTPVWLRIIRKFTEFRAEYSLDGVNYTLITAMIGPWNISYAGLNALNGDQSTAPSIPVDFDMFEIYELPSVAVSPQSVAFANTPVGNTSLTQDIEIANGGPGQLVVSSVVLDGVDPGMYAISSSTCGTLPAIVARDSSCTVSVVFNPTSEGTKFANLAISTNDVTMPINNIALIGTGMPLYSLSLSIAGLGSGSVNSDAGLSCSAGVCTGNYIYGTVVNLYATVSGEASNFAGWSGNCSGTGVCQVIMDKTGYVTANFTLKTYNITTSAGPHGTITPAGTTIYTHGSDFTYTVTPDPGYHIQKVVIDGGSSAVPNSKGYSNTLGNIKSDRFLTVTFAPDTPPGSGVIKNSRTSTEYQTIQDAYENAVSGDVIMLLNGELLGPSFVANIDKTVTLKGGYDSSYASNDGSTVIRSLLFIWKGMIRTEKIILKSD